MHDAQTMPRVARDWLFASDTALWMVPLSAAAIYFTVVLFTRLNGLRTFSTMSGFDFAMTIAVGSLMATTLLNPRPTLLEGIIGVATLFALQRLLSFLRRRSRWAERLVDNEPILLMRGGEVIEAHMKVANITLHDLQAKLRQAGIARPEEVGAVVFETTGTVSVIRGDVDEGLLDGVRQ